MIVDTSYIIDQFRRDADAVAKDVELTENGVTLRLPSMVVQELFIGVPRASNSAAEEQRVRTILHSHPIIPLDASIAERAGTLIGDLRNDGTALSVGDASVAATALVEDEPLLTNDATDFSAIPELTLETY